MNRSLNKHSFLLYIGALSFSVLSPSPTSPSPTSLLVRSFSFFRFLSFSVLTPSMISLLLRPHSFIDLSPSPSSLFLRSISFFAPSLSLLFHLIRPISSSTLYFFLRSLSFSILSSCKSSFLSPLSLLFCPSSPQSPFCSNPSIFPPLFHLFLYSISKSSLILRPIC